MAQSAPASPEAAHVGPAAWSEPLGGTSELTPPESEADVEHAVLGLGIATRRVTEYHGAEGPTLTLLNEAAMPIAAAFGGHVTVWPWTLPQQPTLPHQVLFVEYARLLNARLGGGVREITVTIVLLERVTVLRPRWVQRRTIRMLLIVMMVLAHKAVQDRIVRTRDCWHMVRVQQVATAYAHGTHHAPCLPPGACASNLRDSALSWGAARNA